MLRLQTLSEKDLENVTGGSRTVSEWVKEQYRQLTDPKNYTANMWAAATTM